MKKHEIYTSRKNLKSKRIKDLPSIVENPVFQSMLSTTTLKSQQNWEFLPRKKFLQNSYFKQYFA